MSEVSEAIQAKCLAFGDRIIKLNDYLLTQAASRMSDGRCRKYEIVNWSECVESYIDVEDRVDLYYVTVAELDEFNKAPVIDLVSFVYDVETEGLTEELFVTY